ncbi:MAG: efflux RND transporter permease subunit [Gemmataceae bacterium]|nr:efflux RND transporter permease subunit [Gemmataceae bacterium]
MLPRFFVDRPVFATILSIVIVLAGSLAVTTLPVSQFPDIAPPTIQIDCNYPGASAYVVSQTVAAPIEQQVNGVEDMLYMNSQCTSDGSYTCTITFKSGSDLNLAQVRVQNRVNLALPQLPEVVRATGVMVRKRSPELLLTIGLTSPPEPNYPQGRYDQLYLSNYALLYLRDELQRLPGISDVTIFGQRDYSMRVWLDPDRLAALQLSASDVVNAIRQQNLPLAAGQLGQPPIRPDQPYQFPLTGVGRLIEPADFEQIVVKVGPLGQLVRLRDVARVEMSARSQDVTNRFDDKPTVGLAIFILPDCNALETADAVLTTMARLSRDFPPGLTYEVGYDTTPFIRESIREVYRSLGHAIILVGLVVLLFLGSWRAALIPLAAVPTAIIGTFAVMYAVGFSVNLLTLFGLILAVGIVVDDAIVVVEAVQQYLEHGLTPREATLKAMEQVTGPIIAIGFVLSFVFFPCIFISGIVGSFFKQFALTIAAATLISTFNSLSLSPALCALLLRRPTCAGSRRGLMRWLGLPVWPLRLLQAGFQGLFRASGQGYVWLVGKALRLPLAVLLVYAVMLGAGYAAWCSLPLGFIPEQDKGYLICSVQLPDAASAERTREFMSRISRIALNLELEDEQGNRVRPVRHVNAVAGNSFVLSAYGSNFGSMFVILDSFERRRSPRLSANAVAAALRREFARAAPEAIVNVFGAPAVPRLGRAGGFRLMIEDRGDVGPEVLQGQTDNFIDKANQQKQLVGLFTVYKANSPQWFISVDRAACVSRGLDLSEVYATLQATMGSRYVNDFNRFGRTWQVNVQAEPHLRDQIEDIKRLRVRNRWGEMVPLGAVLQVEERSGPLVITRYNMYPAAAINGNIAPGVSTGEAMELVERLAEQELPSRLTAEWTELMFLEKQSRHTGNVVFVLSVVFVFLVLAALYESWLVPLAVMLVVPVCVASSLGAVWLTDPTSLTETLRQWQASGSVPDWLKPGAWMVQMAQWWDDTVVASVQRGLTAMGVRKQDVNIFTQVGFVVLVGLACKNAILLVEFAREARLRGTPRRQAVLEACRLRYRPIMMTSAAFMFGVLPLAAAQGAGAEIRQAIGIAVLGGMLGVTLFGIIFTPVWFAVVDWLAERHWLQNRWVQQLAAGLMWSVGGGWIRGMTRWGLQWWQRQAQRWQHRRRGWSSTMTAASRSGSSSPAP